MPCLVGCRKPIAPCKNCTKNEEEARKRKKRESRARKTREPAPQPESDANGEARAAPPEPDRDGLEVPFKTTYGRVAWCDSTERWVAVHTHEGKRTSEGMEVAETCGSCRSAWQVANHPYGFHPHCCREFKRVKDEMVAALERKHRTGAWFAGQ